MSEDLERTSSLPVENMDPEAYVAMFEKLAESLPWSLEIPRGLTLDHYRRLFLSAFTTTRKSALYCGHIYSEAVKEHGEEAYQIFTGLHYQESTLKNYRRLSEQIDPALWEEPVADRHFAAIAGQVKDYEEQREWVEYAKETGISGDKLRQEIRENHEARGLRPRPEQATWIQCDKCHGKGGWIEDDS